MPEDADLKVRAYHLERVCKPSIDASQLALKQVDNTESVYSRALVHFPDANLPTVRVDADHKVDWDLFLVLKHRQDWTPTGYGLGDLMYTTSLLPNEEQTLEVKTWETDRRIEEVAQGVEEKNTSDIQSTNSASNEITDRLETKEKAYVDASASYSGFGFSASVKTGWSKDVAEMNQQVGRNAASATEKAANEERSTRKTKVALSRETGSESKTTRRIRNINQTHTLNVNFFEVLREYEVTQYLDAVCLALLGDVVLLQQPAYSEKWSSFGDPDHDGSGEFTSWGELIRGIRDESWVRRFTDLNGQSPIQILQNRWAASLAEAALPTAKNWGLFGSQDPVRLEFQAALLQFVRPGEGWVEPDHRGLFRWAYEVVPGREEGFLQFIEQYVDGAPDGWATGLVTELEKIRREQGRIPVEGRRSQTMVVPTQGMYADVSLGVCSGGEDFIEVNRQFDLELKRLEIEKLQLEVKRQELENQRLESGESSRLEIKGSADKTSLNLDVSAGSASSIEISEP